jgi:hypothetical protein
VGTQLKEYLKRNGKKTSGPKAELVSRVKKIMESDPAHQKKQKIVKTDPEREDEMD